MWLEALEAKFENPDHTKRRYGRREFDQIMGHCQVISDMPATCFTEELIEAYPDAKVILTLRKDVDGWYRCVRSSYLIPHSFFHPPTSGSASPVRLMFAAPEWGFPSLTIIFFDCTYRARRRAPFLQPLHVKEMKFG